MGAEVFARDGVHGEVGWVFAIGMGTVKSRELCGRWRFLV